MTDQLRAAALALVEFADEEGVSMAMAAKVEALHAALEGSPPAAPPASKRIEAPAYLRLVRQLPCYLCRKSRPEVAVEANHATSNRARGKRQGDGEAYPLCRTCHDDYHRMGSMVRRQLDGPAVQWTREYVARRWPGATIPPLDPPEQEIPPPVFRRGR